MNQWTVTTTDTDTPITWGAAGQPHLFWKAMQRPVTPEPFLPVGFELETAGAVFPSTNTPWHDCGAYRWARLAGLGIHLTQRTIAAGIVECAAHVTNAVCDPSVSGSFGGALYYDWLAITPPRGWMLAHEFPLRETSGPNFWPSLWSKTYRMVLFKKDRETAGRVLRCEHLRYDEPLPMGPQRTMVAPGTGRWSDNMQQYWIGPYRVMGQPTPWAHGGTGICPLNCAPLSAENVLDSRRRADTSRPLGAYHAADGHPIMANEWGVPPGWEYLEERGIPFNQRIPIFTKGRTDDYDRAGQAATNGFIAFVNPNGQFWIDKRFNAPNGCAYEAAIRQVYAHDAAHFCRQYQDDLTVATLANDTIAKLRLQAAAADVETSWNLAHSPGLWPGAFSLDKALTQAKLNPHQGGRIPRMQAWSYHPVGAVLIFTPPNTPERAYHSRWAGEALDYAATSATPAFIPQNGGYGSDDSIPWNDFGLALNKRECPLFQIPMWATGVYGLAMAAHGGRTSASTKELVRGSAHALYSNPAAFVPGEYDPRIRGPWRYVVTGDETGPRPAITEGVGYPDGLQLWQHLALAASWADTKEDKEDFIRMALTVNYPSRDVAELRAKLSPTNPWDQHMAMVLA